VLFDLGEHEPEEAEEGESGEIFEHRYHLILVTPTPQIKSFFSRR
jgi:hypothetical protein